MIRLIFLLYYSCKLIHEIIHSFNISLIRSYINSLTLSIHSFIRSFIVLFIHSLIYSFLHSFIPSFIHLFILLFSSGVIDKSSSNKQVLDHLPVERERGITVKAQTATMMYHHAGLPYMLNLIDTPVSG